jgi:hypothetical protein
MALLAATTLGDAADTVHAEVRAEGLKATGSYRLVVQSYDASSGNLPGAKSRPVGSMQRAVTGSELRRGVHVSLLELRGDSASLTPDDPMVVAWIESGEPDLEFDARAARPSPDGVYGVAKRGRNVQISLKRARIA